MSRYFAIARFASKPGFFDLESHSVKMSHMGFALLIFCFGYFSGLLLLFCQELQYNKALQNIEIDSSGPGNCSMNADPTISVVSYSFGCSCTHSSVRIFCMLLICIHACFTEHAFW